MFVTNAVTRDTYRTHLRMLTDTEQALVLGALKISRISFTPTGSRVFADAILPDADYDFYTEDQTATISFLRHLGFREDSGAVHYEDDPNLSSVMRHSSGIDVQLVADVAVKDFVQDLLFCMGVLRHCSKDEARNYWKIGFDACVRAANMSKGHETMRTMMQPYWTRVVVGGLDTPPYKDAVAYIRNTTGEYGILYVDGIVDWLGQAWQAFCDAEITLHPSEDES